MAAGMISIICPTRARPQMLRKMIDSAQATSSTKLEILIGIGSDDLDSITEKNCGYDVTGVSHVLFTGQLPIVHVCNELAEHARGSLIIAVGDDAVFSTPGWDVALIEKYSALQNKIHVFSFQDSRSVDGTPHPIATKEYVKVMGYIHCPIFAFFYPDTWMVEIAKANNCFTHIGDYLLTHDKPSDRGIKDETFLRVRSQGWLTRDREVQRTCQHFLELEKYKLGAYMRKVA